uniref:Uncharacterized protein n=1 Tax=Opuntia streptacantha TaxID=393608 RepID=A0A7C9E804_OPUST
MLGGDFLWREVKISQAQELGYRIPELCRAFLRVGLPRPGEDLPIGLLGRFRNQRCGVLSLPPWLPEWLDWQLSGQILGTGTRRSVLCKSRRAPPTTSSQDSTPWRRERAGYRVPQRSRTPLSG